MDWSGLGALLSIPALLSIFLMTGWAANTGSSFIRPADGMKMIQVPAGEFTMGDVAGTGRRNQQPRRQVTLNEFWIDEHEVSNAQFRLCVNSGSCQAPRSWQHIGLDDPDQPAAGVNWQQAYNYCEWSGARLPTEAEWEKAARGTDGRRFPWGNEASDCSRAHYMHCAGWQTVAVGQFRAGASPYGVLDMAGNVWEWTADWYDADYYSYAPTANPRGPATGQYRVARGGSRISNTRHIETSYRYRFTPDLSTDGRYTTYLGFRCAKTR